MAFNQLTQPRIGRAVAATRKSRTRNWPVQSTVYEQIDSLVDYSAAIAGQVQGVGKGMTAGRNLLAYFHDQDGTLRLKHNIQTEHGRSKKSWPHYPHPSRNVIPVGTSLEEMCQIYPLHCWADGLRIFMAENWTAEKIWSLLPEETRNSGASTRPWNYLQQAMGREADKMYEEDDNGPRVIPKRKRDDMEDDEEVRNDGIQKPAEKRPKLTPKSAITMAPQQIMTTAIQKSNIFLDTPNDFDAFIDWSQSAYQPAEMVNVAESAVTDQFVSSYPVAPTMQLEQVVPNHVIGTSLYQSAHSNLEGCFNTFNQSAAFNQPTTSNVPPVQFHTQQFKQTPAIESIQPSIETVTDEENQEIGADNGVASASQASDYSVSDEEHGDTSDDGDDSTSSNSSEYNSEDDEESIFEFDDEAFGFVDDDEAQPKDIPALMFEPDIFLNAAAKNHQKNIADSVYINLQELDEINAHLGLSGSSRRRTPVREDVTPLSDDIVSWDPVDNSIFPSTPCHTSVDSLSPDMSLFSGDGFVDINTAAAFIQPSAVFQPHMYQQPIPNQGVAHQYMQANPMSYSKPAQHYGLKPTSTDPCMPQQGYFPQQIMLPMRNHPQEQFHQPTQGMMPAYTSSPSLPAVNQGYGPVMSSQMMPFQTMSVYNNDDMLPFGFDEGFSQPIEPDFENSYLFQDEGIFFD